MKFKKKNPTKKHQNAFFRGGGGGGPKWILGVADFVFSWKRTRPLEAVRLFMRRWNKLPKCFFMWNNPIARLLSRLFLAFGSTFACRRFHLETVQSEQGARSRAAIRSHLIQFDKSYLRAASLFIWKRWNGVLPSGPPSFLETPAKSLPDSRNRAAICPWIHGRNLNANNSLWFAF